MVTGEGRSAVRHAEEAVELAEAMASGPTGASARHEVKSQMVLAAALCSAGSTDRARAVGEEALEATGRLRLVPLRWALASLLIDIGSVSLPAQKLREIRDICAGQVRRAGGAWRSA
jgi:hypothetical protein